jgi:hypothetical protein
MPHCNRLGNDDTKNKLHWNSPQTTKACNKLRAEYSVEGSAEHRMVLEFITRQSGYTGTKYMGVSCNVIGCGTML